MKNFKKKVLTFRGRGDMIVNVAGSCGGDARKKFERSSKEQKLFKKLKKFLTNRNEHDKLNELSQDSEKYQRTLITKQ